MSFKSICKLSVICLWAGVLSQPCHALDAPSNGSWLSLGVPSYIHMGTDGAFYLNGTDQGSCAGVRPQHFRVDTSAPHWKEFYAWLLTMSATKREMHCVVSNGCGSDEVWVSYCRGTLN